ncbi:MAG TPA: 3-hydroxybutyryl-CoA dehydrogenase [Synergistaceae bacterium]|jgi:3-hydroxybutyryl-CoA dehydrogenase|nr:3-hydroxybutyryl-CoA dehydrogenase [Synergistaceae bacterium]
MNIKTAVCVIGTGTMGSSTAAAFAAAGFPVFLRGRNAESAERGFERARAAIAVLGDNNLLDQTTEETLSLVTPCTSLPEAVRSASFIVESAPEDLDLKRAFYSEVEDHCSDHAILASNTSGLLPTALAAGLRRPERFVVTHFWNPAHLLPLVEVCPGEKTSGETAHRAMDILVAAGKQPVLLDREAEGFIGNRLQFALLREAFHIVESGVASMEAVDSVVRSSIGRRLLDTGPFESADMGGLDVFASIASYLFKDLSNASAVPSALREAVASGNFGAKTGRGLAPWTPEKRRSLEEKRTATLIGCMKRDRT